MTDGARSGEHARLSDPRRLGHGEARSAAARRARENLRPGPGRHGEPRGTPRWHLCRLGVGGPPASSLPRTLLHTTELSRTPCSVCSVWPPCRMPGWGVGTCGHLGLADRPRCGRLVPHTAARPPGAPTEGVQGSLPAPRPVLAPAAAHRPFPAVCSGALVPLRQVPTRRTSSAPASSHTVSHVTITLCTQGARSIGEAPPLCRSSQHGSPAPSVTASGFWRRQRGPGGGQGPRMSQEPAKGHG